MSEAVYLEDPDEILDYLDPVIRAIDGALDSGVSEADSFFSMPGHALDAGVWSTLVRYGACQWLDQAGCEGFERIPLSFCGIQIVREPLTLRLLKAQKGQAPPPGKSARRRSYYTQECPRLPLDFSGVLMPPVANLLLDWEVTDQRERILHLSKPAGEWEYGQDAVLDWRRSVDVKDTGLGFTGDEETGLLIGSIVDPSELEVGGDAE